MSIKCDYCQKESKLVSGKKIYPHRDDLKNKLFYYCEPCQAYVGCHNNTSKPLGRLANAKLRKWKRMAHCHFDPIWKRRQMTRQEAYQWLAIQLGISYQKCHIGMFGVGLCRKVIEACKERRKLCVNK